MSSETLANNTTTSAEFVHRTDHGRVAILTIDRPERLNAYIPAVGSQIMAHLAACQRDSDIGAVILTGAGDRAFCAGADLKEETTHTVTSMDGHLDGIARIDSGAGDPTGVEFFNTLLAFPKPLICAVNGYAIGIGFQLQFCCDIILASTNAKFRLPQVALGVMPAFGGTPRLAQWVGRGRAAEIALSGRYVGVEEAERIGLVTAVYSPEELRDRALEMADTIAQNSQHSLAMIKQSLINGLEQGQLETASSADIYRFTALSQTTYATTQHSAWR